MSARNLANLPPTRRKVYFSISALTELVPFFKTFSSCPSLVSPIIPLATSIALLSFSLIAGRLLPFHDNYAKYLCSNKCLVFKAIASILLVMPCAKQLCIHNWNLFSHFVCSMCTFCPRSHVGQNPSFAFRYNQPFIAPFIYYLYMFQLLH